MDTTEIVRLMKDERDRLARGIDALEGRASSTSTPRAAFNRPLNPTSRKVVGLRRGRPPGVTRDPEGNWVNADGTPYVTKAQQKLQAKQDQWAHVRSAQTPQPVTPPQPMPPPPPPASPAAPAKKTKSAIVWTPEMKQKQAERMRTVTAARVENQRKAKEAQAEADRLAAEAKAQKTQESQRKRLQTIAAKKGATAAPAVN